MNDETLRQIYQKTNGHCHFCGDRLSFNNYGADATTREPWEVDHVTQRQKGGPKGPENCLAAHRSCNRLRWHRNGRELRELLVLGVLAAEEVGRNTELGKELRYLQRRRIERITKRRVVR